ncbi:CCA-adding enzyme [Clostridiales bacterium]|nr:CCA-adding enzyme [Clostridiales bacterium]
MNENGYEAYVVGGCVRDMILGRIPSDWDITTSARPEEVKACFGHTYDSGIKHGTVTVLMGNDSYEVTTYRVEGSYSDCRHPDNVSFTRNLHEDLLRRDFTMNAIAYHPREGFIDPFNGLEDIKKGMIRGVGCPEERFQEDALRMLRAVRFAAQLNFCIEDATWRALKENAPLIKKISAERIREELQKLIMSKCPEKINFLSKSGLMEIICSQLDDILKSEGNGIAEGLSTAVENPSVRWAIFLAGLGQKQAESYMKELKFDTKTLRAVTAVIGEDKNKPLFDRYMAKKAAERLGDEVYTLLLKYNAAKNRENSEEAIELYNDIKANNECIFMKDLRINGSELKKIGITDGRKIGEALKTALDEVHRDNKNNNQEYLEEFVRRQFLL